MELTDLRNGWRLTATARRAESGFIAMGSAVREGAEPISRQFDEIAGPFLTEAAAVLAALHGLRAWAILEGCAGNLE